MSRIFEFMCEMAKFVEEGRSERKQVEPTAEDLFVTLMAHPNFQTYVGTSGLRAESLRAIYGIAELARREAEARKGQTVRNT